MKTEDILAWSRILCKKGFTDLNRFFSFTTFFNFSLRKNSWANTTTRWKHFFKVFLEYKKFTTQVLETVEIIFAVVFAIKKITTHNDEKS